MTLGEIAAMLQETEIPFVYDHYAERESPEPPFICYLLSGSDNFAADGKVYLKINEVRIELYTDKKDVSVEKQVEDVLDGRGIFYVIGNSAGFPMTQNPPGDATDAHGKYASCCLRASARVKKMSLSRPRSARVSRERDTFL